MGNRNFEIGQQAEKEACEFLEKQGLTFIDNNYKATHSQTGKQLGEIDLIMRDGKYYVFVEVKSRQDDDYGDVLEMVDKYKQSRVILATKLYLLKNGLWDAVHCRFDVIGITPDTDVPIVWIKNAFEVQY